MSSHGRRRPGPAEAGPAQFGPAQFGPAQFGPAQFGWGLLVIAAALIGGLAAAALVHASLTIAVIVSVVVGGIGVVALFRSPARPPEPMAGDYEDADTARFAVPRRPPPAAQPPAAQPSAAQPPRTAPPASFPADPVAPGGRAPATANETVVQLVPLPGNGAEAPDAPWWNSAQGAPPPPSQGAKRVPAPDLSTYLASTFIAQCPRCGAFRLDIQRARNGMDFRCEVCEYTWTWQPGTPWPPVRVMPP